MSLQDIPEKIKIPGESLFSGDRLFVAALLAAVALVSFALGRLSISPTPLETPSAGAVLSARGEERIPSEPVAPASNETPREAVSAEPGMYVGSKNSNKYHLPWCAGAKSISDTNKVWFSSKAEAEAAGYIPSANCKGI